MCPAVEDREGEELDKEEFQGSPVEETGEEEARNVKSAPIPTLPSEAEVAQHRLTHRPFRSWCPHCVRGKGRCDPHKRSGQKDEQSGIPKIASDHFFVGQ